ncbi:MAG: MerR family transcriptional regulator [Candidatus Aminicenantaceae bacterium]
MPENKDNRKYKYYHISSVARMFNVHPQTLRLYEREGLLQPSRSEGNTRLYSDEDLKKLEFILNLTRELGVNLAGVEVVLNMRERMDRMEREVNEFLEFIRQEFYQGNEEEFDKKKNALVRIHRAKIIKFERNNWES